MAEVKARKAPADIPTTNALAAIPDDVLATPAAYYTFGSTPAPMEGPLACGDTEVFMIRVKCTAEHGPIERKDGEMRYTRTMAVQAIWKPGERPPSTDDDQPAMINTDGSIDDEDGDEADDHAGEDDDAAVDNVIRPPFSDAPE